MIEPLILFALYFGLNNHTVNAIIVIYLLYKAFFAERD